MPTEAPHIPTTGERLATVETKLDSVCESVASVQTDLKAFIEAADSRYASKTVERVVYGMIALTMTTVFLALLAIVIRTTPSP